ncbi:MAG: ATP-binding protein [Afipia sp.]|nr:ATP-binding protein [Afipia sp.]OJW66250.1 MAG: ATPase [Afipia sp. 64-13]
MLTPPQIPSLGRIISVRGSQARVGILPSPNMTPAAIRATVGQFFGIRTVQTTIVAIITEVTRENIDTTPDYIAVASVDLLGEISPGAAARFQRGVTVYPTIDDAVDILTHEELRTVYAPSGTDQINVGALQQDPSIIAYIDVEEMLNKHFAVLGSTGVGKSSSVSLLLNEILRVRPRLRIFLLDVHNEYGRCFGEYAQVLNPRNLKLPFWLFNFEEIVDVLFGGRPGVPEEVEVLSEVIPIAKATYTQYQNSDRHHGLKRVEARSIGFTADTPVPYRLVDLISLIDERMGKLENRSSRIVYHKLISRIETVKNDPRYAFMFENANVGGDTMAEVISHLFRLPAHGKPMTIMQLAGFPADVVDSVVSVLCRMAFDFGLWSDGVSPLLFVCEEAHRYASADRSIGFGPTRKAVSRIAKEGRKYGVYLGLVTQRPAELDATILSQCNTLFAMRLANDRDQALLRSAVSDAAANLLSFVPSLGTREVLAFGEGVALPTRLRFKEVPAHQLPRSEATIATTPTAYTGHDINFVSSVVERWRGATGRRDAPAEPLVSDRFADKLGDHPLQRAVEAPLLQPSLGLDPDRFSLLKKPLR